MLQNTSSEGTVKTTDASKLNDDCMTGTPIISKLLLGITRSRTKKLFELKTEAVYSTSLYVQVVFIDLYYFPVHKHAKAKKLTNTKPYLLLASSINKYK